MVGWLDLFLGKGKDNIALTPLKAEAHMAVDCG